MTTIANIHALTPNGPLAGVEFVVAPLQIRVSGVLDGATVRIEVSDGGTSNYVPLTKVEDGLSMQFREQGRYVIHVLDGDHIRAVLHERGPATEIEVEALP